MIVRITPGLGGELNDEGNFSQFHVEISASRENRQSVQKEMERLLEFEDETSVWVSAEGLRALRGASRGDEWNASLDKMIAAARPHGWIRDRPELGIKAHVVWADPAA